MKIIENILNVVINVCNKAYNCRQGVEFDFNSTPKIT